MANYATKFQSASGYTGGYTSDVIRGNFNESSNQTRGVIQVSISSGTVDLEMRLTENSPWVTVKTYDASTIEEVVIAPYMRIVATANAEVWWSETQ